MHSQKALRVHPVFVHFGKNRALFDLIKETKLQQNESSARNRNLEPKVLNSAKPTPRPDSFVQLQLDNFLCGDFCHKPGRGNRILLLCGVCASLSSALRIFPAAVKRNRLSVASTIGLSHFGKFSFHSWCAEFPWWAIFPCVPWYERWPVQREKFFFLGRGSCARNTFCTAWTRFLVALESSLLCKTDFSFANWTKAVHVDQLFLLWIIQAEGKGGRELLASWFSGKQWTLQKRQTAKKEEKKKKRAFLCLHFTCDTRTTLWDEWSLFVSLRALRKHFFTRDFSFCCWCIRTWTRSFLRLKKEQGNLLEVICACSLRLKQAQTETGSLLIPLKQTNIWKVLCVVHPWKWWLERNAMVRFLHKMLWFCWNGAQFCAERFCPYIAG